GIRHIIKKYGKNWQNSTLPICVNLLSDQADHIEKIVRIIETIENVYLIELSINVGNSISEIKDLSKAAIGELPIILSLPFEYVFTEWLDEILTPEIIAISIQAPRGQLIQNDQKVKGRLYGESVLPLTLHAINHLKELNIPVLAGVGAITSKDIEKIYVSGATVFQAHELVWRNYF
ncbi:MAG TPA: hypothetical protein VK856_11515, partial [Anaerolineaceae bacterium]|nr:hypothetical protein [Anaerolineaceae bacterium]